MPGSVLAPEENLSGSTVMCVGVELMRSALELVWSLKAFDVTSAMPSIVDRILIRVDTSKEAFIYDDFSGIRKNLKVC
ncbi:hypothetical protein DPMN_120272 [Dreissena polymorpha]|uniref:Uncharacterized protein n=1 Tax=Dreissena polymorpha TaxID=45954 RepID=A0A9D4GJF8_DREPO|nr:hypothetical protein DPMN_120272 [Dreissena polymorpha]